jgi:hypothetical protein
MLHQPPGAVKATTPIAGRKLLRLKHLARALPAGHARREPQQPPRQVPGQLPAGHHPELPSGLPQEDLTAVYGHGPSSRSGRQQGRRTPARAMAAVCRAATSEKPTAGASLARRGAGQATEHPAIRGPDAALP